MSFGNTALKTSVFQSEIESRISTCNFALLSLGIASTIFSCWTALTKYDERGVPFFAWLLRLAHNAAIDHLRGRRATPAEEVFGADARGDEEAMDRSQTLRDALNTLPDEQRNVVVLRHVVGLTPGEIASAMGRSESSIHGLHHRGRRALQSELTRREAGPSTAVLAVAA